MKIFPRWLTAILALAMLMLLTGGVWFYHAQKRLMRHDAESDLEAVAKLKAEQIVSWRAERLGDAATLAQNPFLAELVPRLINSRQGPDRERLLTIFRSLRQNYHYKNVLLADTGGRILLSLEDESGLLHGEAWSAVKEAFHSRKPLLTDLHPGHDDRMPHIGAVAPFFSGKQKDSRPVAAVILQYDAGQFLYPLVQSWPAVSSTAETLLVRRDGDSVLYLNELRHRKVAALSLRIPLERMDVIAVKAIRGKTGVVEGIDYRGVSVLAAVRPIPDSSWFMVAKVDSDEVLADWRTRSVLIIAMFLGLAAAVPATAGVVWQRNSKAHYRTLFKSERARRESEERYRTTLMSVGDGVIATDAVGQVELLNPVAEELTGWRMEEACGRRVEDVFPIISEETRREVENPVRRVIRDGVVVGLANHTMLISRDGRERPIADSGAPIFGEDGVLTGVVLVFRDQTDERTAQKALQESEERLRSVFLAAPAGIGVLTDRVFLEVNQRFSEMTGYGRDEIIGRNTRMLYHNDEDYDHVGRMLYDEIASRGTGTLETRFRRKDGTDFHALLSSAPLDPADLSRGITFAVMDITDRLHAEEERRKLTEQLHHSQKMESIGRLAGGVAHDFNNMLGVIIGRAELAMMRSASTERVQDDLREIMKAASRSVNLTRQLLAFARKQTINPKVLDLNITVSGMLDMLRRLIGEDISLAWLPGAPLWKVKIDPSQIDQLLANLTVNARDAIAGIGTITIETANVELDSACCSGRADFLPGEYVLLAVSDDGCGMDRETMDAIFDPFFTTKGVGKGTGLGLATVHGIISQNNGFITVYSEPGEGTTFRIYLPRFTDESEVAGTIAATLESPRKGSETVLLVEDEDSILRLGAEILDGLGYSVLSASTPVEALRLAAEYSGVIHLLVTDVVMPEMNGRELAKQLASGRPELRCLFMSGYTADVIAHRGVLYEGVQFIQKPFSTKMLAEKVREVLEGPPAG